MRNELLNPYRHEIPRVYLLAASAVVNGLLIFAIVYLLGERHVDLHFPGSPIEKVQTNRK